FENLKQATQRLSIAVPVALLLILLLLYFSFGSIKQSILIFSAIPMAAIGGIFALLLRGMPFSISAGVGFIALFGVAVLNGIVLITEFNRLKKLNKYGLNEIVLKGTAIRLRPVLMTATVASLGFLPMALSSAAGAEVQKPLATVVIGGLITSTILTLIVLPVLYTYFESFKSKVKAAIPTATIAIFILGLTLFAPAAKAQLPVTGSPLTLQQAIQTALRNNQAVKSSGLQISQQQALRGSSIDLGKTNFDVQYGQINGIKKDNNFSASQNIPNPALFKSQQGLYDAQIRGAEIGLAVTQNDLSYQVKSTYTQLAYFTALQQLYLSQDSVYNSFLKAAALRYETGETNLLEKTTAETQYNEVRNQMSKNQSDILAYTSELKRLLNSQAQIEISKEQFVQV
ncbi:MAG: CusA/CzcA family heavy metal efflux RND transporter, partial [Sphingobacteriales bacterium 39-40-5]